MLSAATAIPEAFDGVGAWFALPYTAVRLLGLALYWFGLRDQPEHQAALRAYLPIATVGPTLVLAGGLLGDTARVLAVERCHPRRHRLGARSRAGEFQVDPGHFAERHGLVVIIALGESVIATGTTVTEIGLTRDVAALLVLSFAAVAGLWWTYFDWVHHAAESRLAGEPARRRRGHLARDLFTLGHLPIVAGTIVFAASIEEALLHPTEPLDSFGATAVGLGPSLYLAGFVVGNLRATGRILPTRLGGLVAIVTIALVVAPYADAIVSTQRSRPRSSSSLRSNNPADDAATYTWCLTPCVRRADVSGRRSAA